MSKTNTNHVMFFETFFTKEELAERYAEVPVNGWWLIRHFDGNRNCMTIDVYSKESYQNYGRGQTQFLERKQQLDFIKSL